ncbi:MAG: hypothetical protein EOP84_22555 [Verrucomicrobiaceae bacterium]|nr:MAG: hypothetical protein EOP84_22555 [Verrucomicrobiaceae bacterium]
MRFRLQRVHYMPKEVEPGVLYVSEEFGTAAHLCACGCGSKIRTPLGLTEWTVTETCDGPSLTPSIGNWQQACQSHYWIDRGEVLWSEKWTTEQVIAGRYREEKRRQNYYETINRRRAGPLRRLWYWMTELFNR